MNARSDRQNTGNQDGRLFGFSYQTGPDLDEIASKVSPVPPNMDDGVTVAGRWHSLGYGVDIDGAGSQKEVKT